LGVSVSTDENLSNGRLAVDENTFRSAGGFPRLSQGCLEIIQIIVPGCTPQQFGPLKEFYEIHSCG